jgi:hypothetical protein
MAINQIKSNHLTHWTGFSYSEEGPGSLSNIGDYQHPSVAPVTGGEIFEESDVSSAYISTEWHIINAIAIDSTALTAAVTWHTIQDFFTA